MELRLDGKVLLVTGATQGVGLAIAESAKAAGAEGIVLTGRDPVRGAAAAAALGARFIACDLSEPGAASALYAAALAPFGRVDALVNAAGLTSRGGLLTVTPDLWDTLFRVNAQAPFFLMQAHVEHLKERRAPGEIVNILSINIHGGAGDLAVYSASKAALALLTKSAAQHHRYDRIRVNGIALGWTDTPAERQMQAETLGHGPGWLAAAEARQPFGRLLRPQDVARLTLFLLSPASEPMTGAVIDQEQHVTAGVV